jgi:nitrogen fixation protein FixH
MRALLGIGILVGLGTVVATVIIGNRLAERTVVPDPYESGLRWDATQRERQRTAWKIAVLNRRIRTGRQDLLLAATGRDSRSPVDVQIEIRFLRPFASLSERTIRAERRSDGLYRISVDIPERGRWDLEISVIEGDSRTVFEDHVTVE